MSPHWSTLWIPECQLIVPDWTTILPEFHKAKEFQLENQGSINTRDTSRVHNTQMFRHILFYWKEGNPIITRSTLIECVLSLAVESPFLLRRTLWGKCFGYPHFTDENWGPEFRRLAPNLICTICLSSSLQCTRFTNGETEAPRNDTTCQSHTAEVSHTARGCCCVGRWNGAVCLGNTLAFPSKGDIALPTIAPSNSTLRNRPKNGKPTSTRTHAQVGL